MRPRPVIELTQKIITSMREHGYRIIAVQQENAEQRQENRDSSRR